MMGTWSCEVCGLAWGWGVGKGFPETRLPSRGCGTMTTWWACMENRAHGAKAHAQIRRCNEARWEGSGGQGLGTVALEAVLRREASSRERWEGMVGGERQAGQKCGQISALETSVLMGYGFPGTAGGRVGECSHSGQDSVSCQSYCLCIPMTPKFPSWAHFSGNPLIDP